MHALHNHFQQDAFPAAPLQAANDNSPKTFGQAAKSYIDHGGNAHYLPNIIERLGDRQLSQIYPFDVKQVATDLYPTQKNATRNRCVITPVRVVFNHAYERGWGPLIRLRSFKEDPPKRKAAASQAWLHAFVRQADKDGLPHISALVLFMSQTGSRVSEALRLQWAQVDMLNRTAVLLRTKTGVNSKRFLTDQLVNRFFTLSQGKAPEDRVFTNRCRYNINERIGKVCERAGISYKPSHTCGRHAFANISLSLGMDIKSTMDAGGWKSPVVFLGVYVNPRNAGRAVADRMNLYQYDNDL